MKLVDKLGMHNHCFGILFAFLNSIKIYLIMSKTKENMFPFIMGI
jgi:hypothetical protein